MLCAFCAGCWEGETKPFLRETRPNAGEGRWRVVCVSCGAGEGRVIELKETTVKCTVQGGGSVSILTRHKERLGDEEDAGWGKR